MPKAHFSGMRVSRPLRAGLSATHVAQVSGSKAAEGADWQLQWSEKARAD
jgi:hypothetical protein